MNKFKQWVKDHQDLVIIGGAVVVAAGATVALVMIGRKGAQSSGVLSLNPAKAPKGFEKHDYAGLLSIGPEGDMWAHPDNDIGFKEFKVGHADFENRIMYYSEYPHAGPCPEVVFPGVDLNNLDSVEAAMAAQEIANT